MLPKSPPAPLRKLRSNSRTKTPLVVYWDFESVSISTTNKSLVFLPQLIQFVENLSFLETCFEKRCLWKANNFQNSMNYPGTNYPFSCRFEKPNFPITILSPFTAKNSFPLVHPFWLLAESPKSPKCYLRRGMAAGSHFPVAGPRYWLNRLIRPDLKYWTAVTQPNGSV